jgi:membrane protease YdiL (CAAX protease family)
MELLWRLAFVAAIGSFVWFLHKFVGSYPAPLPRSTRPGRNLGQVLGLWTIALVVPALRIHAISPWLRTAVPDRTLRELVQVPLVSIPYLLVPMLLVLVLNDWKARDLGLTLAVKARSVAVVALAFGFTAGIVPVLTGQAVVGVERLPWGALVLLLYNNDFLEEFFHRGVIQSLLERTLGQQPAIWLGGVLFGATHIVFDVSRLLESGVAFVCLAAVMQTMAGWILGMVFMKTRSLWPGVASHYLANWLPSVVLEIGR